MTKSTTPRKPRLRKFHVGTGQSDQEIIDQFVVRQNELDTVLEVLERNIEADSCQHLLVVAPRGRGKTTLLVRVIAELRTNPRYTERLVPVRLMEESQEIFTLADFWLECLYYLAKASGPIDPIVADELRASHAVLTESWTDPALESRARATVLDAADRLGRKLVIMLENLQALSHAAEPDFGWDLRQVLQTEPQVMLLATATSRFAALEDAEEPFFELFRTLCLAPLDTEECRRLWEAISGEVVDTRRIRPLRILTGGSPRLMVVLAGFSRDRSVRQLMDDLVELIDDHTEYFRGHIEDLASSERRVYLALIDLWQESTSAEVAARARMDIRKVSAFLGRLVERGAVVAEGSGRNRTYYAAERLYSIYYKLRRDRDEAAVVRNLIHFMVTYYHGDELTDFSRQLVTEAFESEGIRQGLARAANEVPELRTLLESQGMSAPDLPEKPGGVEPLEELIQIRRHFESDDFEAVIRLVDSVIATDPIKPIINPVAEAKAIIWKGLAKGRLGDVAAASETYDALIARFGDSTDRELQVQVARALFNKGVTQGQLGDTAAAIETFDAVVARFGDSADQELQDAVGGAIRNAAESLCMIDKADDALRKADELLALGSRAHSAIPVAHAAWVEAMARALLGETKRVEELFRQIRSAFDRDDEDMLRTFQEDVPTLVALGADPGVLADILEEDKETHEALRPLAVALRLEAGEKVRAPAEMLEVAADIRAAIEEKRRQRNR